MNSLGKATLSEVALFLEDFHISEEIKKLKDEDWNKWLANETTKKFLSLIAALQLDCREEVMNADVHSERFNNTVIYLKGVSYGLLRLMEIIDEVSFDEEKEESEGEK